MSDFVWPATYCALRDAGRFDYWGAPYSSLTNAERDAREAAHRHQVLWWRSEWESPPGLRREVLRPGLVPFAGTGCGDRFCFYPRWQRGAEPPVVLWLHDALESELWARSFSEFLVRQLLVEQSEWSDECDGDEAVRRELYLAHRGIVLPQLADPDRAWLLALGDSPTRDACELAEADLAGAIGVRRLVGSLPPERYAEEYFRDRTLLIDTYARDADFLRELVEEGHEALRPRWTLALANLARVRG